MAMIHHPMMETEEIAAMMPGRASRSPCCDSAKRPTSCCGALTRLGISMGFPLLKKNTFFPGPYLSENLEKTLKVDG